MPYYTYILQSEKSGKYYIGSTGDLEERIARHNEGRSKYTGIGIPWKLEYFEEFQERSSAIKREKYIKSRKSKVFIEELIRTSRWTLSGRSPHWLLRDNSRRHIEKACFAWSRLFLYDNLIELFTVLSNIRDPLNINRVQLKAPWTILFQFLVDFSGNIPFYVNENTSNLSFHENSPRKNFTGPFNVSVFVLQYSQLNGP